MSCQAWASEPAGATLTANEEAALAELEVLAKIRLCRYEAKLAGRLLGMTGTAVLYHERKALERLRRMLNGRYR